MEKGNYYLIFQFIIDEWFHILHITGILSIHYDQDLLDNGIFSLDPLGWLQHLIMRLFCCEETCQVTGEKAGVAPCHQ